MQNTMIMNNLEQMLDEIKMVFSLVGKLADNASKHAPQKHFVDEIKAINSLGISKVGQMELWISENAQNRSRLKQNTGSLPYHYSISDSSTEVKRSGKK